MVAIQASSSMRPPDPDGVNPLAAHAGALGSEGAAKDLLAKLDSMQAQVSVPLTNFVLSVADEDEAVTASVRLVLQQL